MESSKRNMANPLELAQKQKILDQAMKEKSILELVAQNAQSTNTSDYHTNLEQVAQRLQKDLSLAEKSGNGNYASQLSQQLGTVNNLRAFSLIDDYANLSLEPQDYTGGED